ncbi:MAG: hypothetical protein M3530_01840 [Thermoproteota archaeon]|nr:hypothetical protein [Thermoproteota archaeon]
MNFDRLETYAEEANQARSSDQMQVAEKLEEEIMKWIAEEELVFPVEKDVLINGDSASFLYKNNRTYPKLFEFIARTLHLEIPLEINKCKFGPGEIIVVASNNDQAQQTLLECSHELQNRLKAKKGRIA